MSSRFVNLSLLFVTIVLLATGVLLFATNRVEDAWLYDLHRYAGAALLILLIPKTRIIWRALSRQLRRGTWFNLTTFAGVGLSTLLLLSLALALAWTLNLLPFYLDVVLLYVTPLGLHWYLAFALVPFFAWHVLQRWVPLPRALAAFPPRQPAISRRTAINLLGVGALGLLGFGALDALAATTHWARRFTGSRLVQSFAANDFPVTNSDAPPNVDIANWRLRVTGRVARPLELTYTDLLAAATNARTATVDCTLGWASTQAWRGVFVAGLLERAGVAADAREVMFRATTGYYAALEIEQAREALIATHVGGQVLSSEHGFPARLVAPSRRGYHWIKWMSELVVS
jgi:Oxidoreductase molybdopterin binding domain